MVSSAQKVVFGEPDDSRAEKVLASDPRRDLQRSSLGFISLRRADASEVGGIWLRSPFRFHDSVELAYRLVFYQLRICG